MHWRCAVIFCFAFVILNVSSYNDPRVIGGGTSPNGTFLFLPRLIFPKVSTNISPRFPHGICSSTIISKRHILTAAHCVIESVSFGVDITTKKKKKGNLKIVRKVYGLVDEPPQERKIVPFDIGEYGIATRIYFHPSYNSPQHLNDIAILEFPEGTVIQTEPITLINNYEPKDGDYGVIAGYGKYKYNKNGVLIIPQDLQNATVPLFTPQSCTFKKNVNNICIGYRNLMALQGDSGGPLMINKNETFYQIGVSSFHIEGRKEWHSFYSPLSIYCPWIEKVTKNEVKCQPLPELLRTTTPSSNAQTTYQDIPISAENLEQEVAALHKGIGNNCNIISFKFVVFVVYFIIFK